MNACRRNGKFGERSHRLDAGLGLQAVAKGVEVELGLEMMHAGLEDRLAVQGDPEPDRPRPRQVGKDLVGEVLGGLLGGQVEVGEDDDPGDGMLEDLGAPAGMRPRRGTVRGARSRAG